MTAVIGQPPKSANLPSIPRTNPVRKEHSMRKQLLLAAVAILVVGLASPALAQP